jgi:adenylosuccinate synthase
MYGFEGFAIKDRVDFIVGGQWGSEGKGAAAAYLARRLCEENRIYDIVTTNAGAQAGHTSTHNGVTRVAFHLPTAALIAHDYGLYPLIYLNAGSIIDPTVLETEVQAAKLVSLSELIIHPNAAIITDSCRDAEMRSDSAQTRIAGTRKGVGEALARKVLRYGMLAKDHPYTRQFIYPEFNLITAAHTRSVLVEVPQGIGLSLDGSFYPYCTSRNCTVMQAMSDAGLHPHSYGASLLVIRTFPIRVGSIRDPGTDVAWTSGGHYDDQHETSWNALGVTPEITTVTKRVRRVFTYSYKQLRHAMQLTRPNVVQITFCDYPGAPLEVIAHDVFSIANDIGIAQPVILYQNGPTTHDVWKA